MIYNLNNTHKVGTKEATYVYDYYSTRVWVMCQKAVDEIQLTNQLINTKAYKFTFV